MVCRCLGPGSKKATRRPAMGKKDKKKKRRRRRRRSQRDLDAFCGGGGGDNEMAMRFQVVVPLVFLL